VSPGNALVQPAVEVAPASIIPDRIETATVAKAAAVGTPQGAQATFVLYEPNAKEVWLCGDFNAWATGVTPMKRQPGGEWIAAVGLEPGRYEYKFVVDGHWIPDPLARENIWNFHGTLNSVIEVRS
jgi:1,4-alpha-glucan branching enzyme